MSFSKSFWDIDASGALCLGDEQIAYPADFCRSDEINSGPDNLRLVVAAPELFFALKELSMAVHEHGFDLKVKRQMDRAFEAIKLATGVK